MTFRRGDGGRTGRVHIRMPTFIYVRSASLLSTASRQTDGELDVARHRHNKVAVRWHGFSSSSNPQENAGATLPGAAAAAAAVCNTQSIVPQREKGSVPHLRWASIVSRLLLKPLPTSRATDRDGFPDGCECMHARGPLRATEAAMPLRSSALRRTPSGSRLRWSAASAVRCTGVCLALSLAGELAVWPSFTRAMECGLDPAFEIDSLLH